MVRELWQIFSLLLETGSQTSRSHKLHFLSSQWEVSDIGKLFSVTPNNFHNLSILACPKNLDISPFVNLGSADLIPNQAGSDVWYLLSPSL